jgi:predicted small integral membrane protein
MQTLCAARGCTAAPRISVAISIRAVLTAYKSAAPEVKPELWPVRFALQGFDELCRHCVLLGGGSGSQDLNCCATSSRPARAAYKSAAPEVNPERGTVRFALRGSDELCSHCVLLGGGSGSQDLICCEMIFQAARTAYKSAAPEVNPERGTVRYALRSSDELCSHCVLLGGGSGSQDLSCCATRFRAAWAAYKSDAPEVNPERGTVRCALQCFDERCSHCVFLGGGSGCQHLICCATSYRAAWAAYKLAAPEVSPERGTVRFALQGFDELCKHCVLLGAGSGSQDLICCEMIFQAARTAYKSAAPEVNPERGTVRYALQGSDELCSHCVFLGGGSGCQDLICCATSFRAAWAAYKSAAPEVSPER